MPKTLARLPLLALVLTIGAVGCGHVGPSPDGLAAQARRQELIEARLRRLEGRIRRMDHVLSLVEARPRAARPAHAQNGGAPNQGGRPRPAPPPADDDEASR